MQSTHTAQLSIPGLPKAALEAHLFPALKNTSLLSISQLCDSDCEALFTKNKVQIKHQGQIALEGTQCPDTNLWMVPLAATAQANNSVTLPSKAPDLLKHSHAALFSPTLSTLTAALQNGLLNGFRGLTLTNLKKYPPTSMAMHKGHLDQTRANQNSTKSTQHKKSPSLQPLTNGTKTLSCYAKVTSFTPQAQTHSDQTGKFPVTSKQGNKYVFVLYDYDSNSIQVRPLKNREANSILSAFKSCHQVLSQAGLKPKLHRLDNECSAVLKEYLIDNEVDYQLVPPGIHRRNAAKKAIQTFKNHFIAGLSSTHPDFPLNLWDQLLEQAELTLNLLRQS